MAISVPRYTIEELQHFPDDGNRYELLDGLLLVTPSPGVSHEVVVARLAATLAAVVQATGDACVVCHGAVVQARDTQLEPDLLVFPSRFAGAAKWQEITERWLAVEVVSRSSRIYDREFKRDAYLALGVQEVWLVDRHAQTVEVSRARGVHVMVDDVLRWWPPGVGRVVEIPLAELFAGTALE
ncbi:MAG TPA: Uma2 family endonuclease [Gemmatimonadaceae bacterium]|nr:Uma2 family endonuclease [Gemmatimonadaceae bacterium]